MKVNVKSLQNKSNIYYTSNQGGQHMEKSSYQRLRQKMEKIKRWIYIKEWEFSKDNYPEKEVILKHLKELEAIIYEKDNDSAS